MDLEKTIEFLVNDSVVANVPVDLAGGAVLSYLVPAGQIRNALRDLTYCDGTFSDEGAVLCRVETQSGDSMALRYQP